MSISHYPAPQQVDHWCAGLLARADAIAVSTEMTDPIGPGVPVPFSRNAGEARYVRFERQGAAPYYGIWQPVLHGGPAPLLVHVPGYGAEMSVHPWLVAAGFNVLHISPQGYCTPKGFDESKRVNGTWPVLPDTVTSFGERGYVDWLTDALAAVAWALHLPAVQPQRVGVLGTSQGGGMALVLASLLRDRGLRAVAADEPFLTGIHMMQPRRTSGPYNMALNALDQIGRDNPQRLPDAWRAVGLVDTHSHAHRLTMPTLLTTGLTDVTCPTDTIHALFHKLPATRALVDMAGQPHGYTRPFGELARAWFSLYV